MLPGSRGLCFFVAFHCAGRPMAPRYGSAVLPPLTGRLRPKPENIGPMALRSKEPAPEERGDVKFLHVGLLLLGQPEASSGKEQAAVRGRCSRCWPAGCRSGSWS